AAAAHAVVSIEVSTDEDLPIALHGGRINSNTRALLKAHVKAAVRVQPGEAAAVRVVEISEISPNEDLPIGLHGGGGNPLTSTRANVESRVQTSVRVQPGDAVPARAIVAGEISPDDDLLIGL